MRRDAGTEVEGDAVEVIALPRRTIRAALLQAGDVRIAVVPAARTLSEIAAERRNVPDLRRGEAPCGRREARIGRGDAAIGSDRRDRRECADARGAIRAPGDA